MHPKIAHSIHKKDLLLKYQEQKKQRREQQENAIWEAKKLANILVEEFGIETVYLVGPLSYGQFQEGMTLELAFEEISPGLYARALGHLKQISSCKVDLIDMQQADSWTKRSIRERGKILAVKREV